MNTPLNDALKPCALCGALPELCDYTNKPAASWVLSHKERGCMLRIVNQYPTKDAAIAAWNTRVNTPESSNSPASNGAAQGAMTDERNYIVKNEGQFATCAGMPPHDFEDKDGYPLWRHNTIKQHFAQPSDATAQPRVDDSLQALIANDEFAMTFQTLGQYRKALLANTAQGKPEGMTIDDWQEKYLPAMTESDAKLVQRFIDCHGLGAIIVEADQYDAVVRALAEKRG